MTFYIAPLENRTVLKITGSDRLEFLQGISSNDVSKVADDNGVYTCFLTPQGKFLFDMFITALDDDTWLADVEKGSAPQLIAHLSKYKLRSDVIIEPADNHYDVLAVYGGALPTQLTEDGIIYHDPREAQLGWRCFIPQTTRDALQEDALKVGGEFVAFDEYDAFRLSLGVPDGSRDILREKMHLIEANIEQLSGVSFQKGCFTGQELTARVHNRGLVKKRLLPMRITHAVETGDTVTNLEGQTIGTINSHSERYAMAYVKLEPAKEILAGADRAQVNGQEVELFKPDWLTI